jgi:hypothetical protein
MYILICSDAVTFDDSTESAVNIATTRLKKGLWPLYKGTRNRIHLKRGDTCLIYLAGSSEWAQHLYAVARVATKRNRKTFEVVDSEDLLVNAPDQVLELENISRIDPIPIRSFHGKLSFMSSAKWGAAFQGGCRRLSPEDKAILERHVVRTGSQLSSSV